jgi:hypothetical protein
MSPKVTIPYLFYSQHFQSLEIIRIDSSNPYANFRVLKQVGLLHGRVVARAGAAGAASKFLPGARAASM